MIVLSGRRDRRAHAPRGREGRRKLAYGTTPCVQRLEPSWGLSPDRSAHRAGLAAQKQSRTLRMYHDRGT